MKKQLQRLSIILIGLFIGIGIYTFYYAQGYSYMLDDPDVCTNCHVMREQYDGWMKSSHQYAASCNDCHIPHSFLLKYFRKGENGYMHSLKFTLQNFHEPIAIRQVNAVVLQRNCIKCHQGMVNDINIGPYGTKSEISCLHCHSQVGHGPQK